MVELEGVELEGVEVVPAVVRGLLKLPLLFTMIALFTLIFVDIQRELYPVQHYDLTQDIFSYQSSS
jgi:hypothetical protein